MDNIQALETVYAGVRFRSRLEARWAVYFTHRGWRWEYEPEGFELPDGGRYLPDFWLPELGAYVEVKDASRWPGEPHRFYCAGKIGRSWRDFCRFDDWRQAFGAQHGAAEGEDMQVCTEDDDYAHRPELSMSGWNAAYVGPTLVNDGHGPTFGEDGHGAGGCGGVTRATIYATCKRQIASADTVFAYLDSPDCYGTLVEIGLAHGLGVTTMVAVDPGLWNIPDYWFSMRGAKPTILEDRDPAGWVKDELSLLAKPIPNDIRRAQRFIAERGGVIVYGSPGKHRYIYASLPYAAQVLLQPSESAASAARSERFGT